MARTWIRWNAFSIQTLSGSTLSKPTRSKLTSRLRFVLAVALSSFAVSFVIPLYAAQSNEAQGSLAEEVISAPGAKMLLSWQDDFKDRERRKIREWLSYAAESASLIDGVFPTRNVNLQIHKLTKGKGPVPWAHTVRRIGNEGVVFHVNPRKSLKRFKDDWTATHEFSHLYLPYVGRDDIWISEGFASYYQYILMMRQGTLSPLEGWQKIKDGFDRGAADKNQAGTLEAASRQMRQQKAFKRVYWSGALYFLDIDLQLRSQGQSLDKVISNFRQCCKDKNIDWNGMQLAKQLDLASDTTLFSEKYREYTQIVGFPSYEDKLEKLGIEYSGKKIRFTDDSAAQSLRHSISSIRSID